MTAAARIVIHQGNDQHTPIVTGCPFPADVDLSHGATIHQANGATTVAQATPLTGPTPGGVRWWELSFLADAMGEADVTPADAPASESNLCNQLETGGVQLDNGLVQVDLPAAGDAPLRITWPGGSGTLTPQLETEQLGPCREASGEPRTINILRNGSIRTQVEILGKLVGKGGAIDYRLTVEMWHDHRALRVDWMLTNCVTGLLDINITRATLLGDWDVGGESNRVFRQSSHTSMGLPRDVVNADAVRIVADETTGGAHVADPTMLLDDSDYPFYHAPPLVGTGRWLELRGKQGRVSMQVVDFEQTRPNALDCEGERLSYEMVPEGCALRWAQGWRKEQQVLLAFAEASDDTAPAALAQQAGAMFSPCRAQPTPATLRALKCFDLDRILACEPGRNLRFGAMLSSLCVLLMPGSKFDLGDTPDWHYTRGYATSPNQYLPVPGAEDFPRVYSARGYMFPDLMKYFVQPVWTNNEYDIIHTVAIEIMRTGDNEHFTTLRWTARHNVEIDFLSFSDDPSHHRASPFHSHFHNRKGAITSHFWTQGLIQYYCLTGDRDALEVAKALGDKIIEFNHDENLRKWAFDREVGWALLALCCLAEAGFDEYLDEASAIATYLQKFDRKAHTGAVKLSAGRAGRNLERQMVDAGFGYSSMIEALDRYETIAGNEASAVWFDTLLRQLKNAVWEKARDGERPNIRDMTGLVMAIGYERTGDSDFLTAGRLMLEAHLDLTINPAGGVPIAAGTEEGQVKPNALAYRGLHRLLGALDRAGEIDRYEYPAMREHFGKS